VTGREGLIPQKYLEKEQDTLVFQIDYDRSLLLGDSAHHAMIVTDDDDDSWIMKSKNVSYKKAKNEIEMLDKFQREGVPTLPFNGKAPF
jgi:hypothetical protein